jgi:hypothetical protein
LGTGYITSSAALLSAEAEMHSELPNRKKYVISPDPSISKDSDVTPSSLNVERLKSGMDKEDSSSCSESVSQSKTLSIPSSSESKSDYSDSLLRSYTPLDSPQSLITLLLNLLSTSHPLQVSLFFFFFIVCFVRLLVHYIVL